MMLRYRSDASAEWHTALPGGRVLLDADRPWIFDGSAEAVQRCAAALGRFAESLTEQTLRVLFGNAVGIFLLPGDITLEVQSGKWSESHFEWMLRDLVSTCAALPLLATTDAGALPYERTDELDDISRYHAFVYLRHILGQHAAEGDRLEPAIDHVLRDPHRRTEAVRRVVPLERASATDGATLHAIAAKGSLQKRARGGYPGLPPSWPLGDFVPTTINQPHRTREVDTPENRFVRAFLEGAQQLVADVRDRTHARNDHLGRRLAMDCERMGRDLALRLGHPLWSDVGRLTHVPLASTVLQRRRGYRDILRHHVRLPSSPR